jgi:DNA-binding CsgD family transcriptional regulator
MFDDREFTSERRLLSATLVAFVAMAILAAVDLLSDLREGTTLSHVLAEGGILLVGFIGAGLVARKLIATTRSARSSAAAARLLAGQLEATTAEATRWRTETRDILAGLAQAIDQQFDRWELSAAEKEVALLLLKGLSYKEIAEVRTVTEATARQQGRAVFEKAGLSGRADLSAFFLEELLLPSRPDGAA